MLLRNQVTYGNIFHHITVPFSTMRKLAWPPTSSSLWKALQLGMTAALFLLLLLGSVPTASAIWPKPQRMTHGTGVLWMSRDVEFTYPHHPGPQSYLQRALHYVRR